MPYADPEQRRAYHREYLRKWRAEHREQENERARQYRAADPEKVRATQRAHYDRNAEKYREYSREYSKANPGWAASHCRKRLARKKKATPAWATEAAMRRFYAEAAALRAKSGERWEVDHIVPLNSKYVCGLHVEHNLQVIPMPDNRRKYNRHWPDMWT